MRRAGAILYAVALMVGGCCRLMASERIYASTEEEFHEEHWIWSPDLFSRSHLARFAAEFRSRAARAVNRALVFSNRAEANSIAMGKGMSDYPYDLWKRKAEYAAQSRGRIAEIIITKRGGLLRLRTAVDTAVTRDILWGLDPFRLDSHPAVDLLWLTFPDRRRMGLSIQVYAKMEGAESEAQLHLITGAIAKLLSLHDVLVSLRRDPWFVYSEPFPPFYPFLERFHIPPEEVIDRDPTITCSFRSGKVRCWKMTR